VYLRSNAGNFRTCANRAAEADFAKTDILVVTNKFSVQANMKHSIQTFTRLEETSQFTSCHILKSITQKYRVPEFRAPFSGISPKWLFYLVQNSNENKSNVDSGFTSWLRKRLS
jgi:hypothetical protein